jgi:type 1 fimbriae regulatory protein FimB/type 1 fimbriae regulatory protein FimE
MRNSSLALVAPIPVFATVTPPRRQKNADLRPREYLTGDEVERLMDAARKFGRYGHRDATMILIAFRHGLRPSEVCGLRWDQFDLKAGKVHCARRKNGAPSVHPLGGVELRALRRLQRESPPSPYVFVSERGAPFTPGGFARTISRLGVKAGFSFPVHPHMLRHATGFKLANEGVDTRSLQHYLGHRNIQHTVRYTALRDDRFKNFWKD